MEVANTLAYYDTATITAVKSFIVQAPGQLKCFSWQAFPVPGAYPRVEHLKGPSFEKAVSILANNRLGQKGLPETNTLAF